MSIQVYEGNGFIPREAPIKLALGCPIAGEDWPRWMPWIARDRGGMWFIYVDKPVIWERGWAPSVGDFIDFYLRIDELVTINPACKKHSWKTLYNRGDFIK